MFTMSMREPDAVSNAKPAAHIMLIRVYDETGNVIDTRASGNFQRVVSGAKKKPPRGEA
jgi:hypothetical protein